jgi:hypothetical protein
MHPHLFFCDLESFQSAQNMFPVVHTHILRMHAPVPPTSPTSSHASSIRSHLHLTFVNHPHRPTTRLMDRRQEQIDGEQQLTV